MSVLKTASDDSVNDWPLRAASVRATSGSTAEWKRGQARRGVTASDLAEATTRADS